MEPDDVEGNFPQQDPKEVTKGFNEAVKLLSTSAKTLDPAAAFAPHATLHEVESFAHATVARFENPDMEVHLSQSATPWLWYNSPGANPKSVKHSLRIDTGGSVAVLLPGTGNWHPIGMVVSIDYGSEGIVNVPPPAPASSYMGVINDLRRSLPGLEAEVDCPEHGELMPIGTEMECVEAPGTIWYMVQHLNDDHRWSREAIADWLETLPVDLTFRTPDE